MIRWLPCILQIIRGIMLLTLSSFFFRIVTIEINVNSINIKHVIVPFNMIGCSEYPIEYNWYWTLDHSEYLCLNSLRLFFLSPIAFKQIKCVISSSEYTFVGVANRVILAVLQNLEKTQLHELLKYALGLNVKFNKPW